MQGKIQLPAFPQPPPMLKALLEGTDRRAGTFKKYIIPINNALSLSRIKVKKKVNSGFNPTVIIQGKVYQYIDTLDTSNDQSAGLYVHDPLMQNTSKSGSLYLPSSAIKQDIDNCQTIFTDLKAELEN